jgi:hypothetical protein
MTELLMSGEITRDWLRLLMLLVSRTVQICRTKFERLDARLLLRHDVELATNLLTLNVQRMQTCNSIRDC